MTMTDFVSIDSRKYPGLAGMGYMGCACQNDDRTQPGMAGYGLGGVIENVGIFTDQDTGHQVMPMALPGGAQGYYDPQNRIYLDATGRNLGTSVPGGTGGGSGSGVLDGILSGVNVLRTDPTVAALAQTGISRLVPGAMPAPPPPPVQQGPGIGTVLLVLAGLGAGGYAFSKYAK